ncbi:SWIM zinc finger family protein [Nonomuraea sp. NPDC050786]|uniref:SWIM zinc finger family protein n=1 Tax=Nonomuraea sp. NPDC050786 TaxID=3154840 RepID=UPI0033C47BB8
MIERWSRDQVLALAPDASSQKAAQGVATPGKWSLRGTTGTILYGECKGSGARPYLACVDLTEPAYRCSCPSRKFPCKHALGLLLMWSADGLPAAEGAPQWVTEWVEGRAERAAKAAAKIEAARARKAAESAIAAEGTAAGGTAAEGAVAGGASGVGGSDGASEGGASEGGASGGGASGGGASGVGRSRADGEAAAASEGRPESVRHGRVAAGLTEVERWLDDQVRQGLAGAAEHEWEGLAKRLIDAQAPGVAGVVSRLGRVRADDDWPGRLLEEYALIRLLAIAYRRRAELPAPLAETVLSRVGFPVSRDEVLAGSGVRDRWDVLGRRDEVQDRLTARRVWLRGRHTGRAALVLSFAPQGQPLDASLVTGTTIDADLAFYPGAAPLRALVAARYDSGEDDASSGAPPGAPPPDDGGSRGGPPSDDGGARGGPPGVAPDEALDEVARVLAEDPWTESWPLVLAGVVPGRASLGALPLHPVARDPWRLIAVSGGRPLTVAVEWTPRGLRPLTTWDDEGTAVIL